MGGAGYLHGRYTADSVARRREVAALIRAMRALAVATEAELLGRPWAAIGSSPAILVLLNQPIMVPSALGAYQIALENLSRRHFGCRSRQA